MAGIMNKLVGHDHKDGRIIVDLGRTLDSCLSPGCLAFKFSRNQDGDDVYF